MSRLFRHRPPDTAVGRVLRPAVQRVLSGRFDRQVTSVVAGAGFGKTTALVQAFEENRLAPLGVDLWLACEPGDADAHRLLAGLAASLEVDHVEDSGQLLARVVEACGARAPLDLSITFDDVHLLPAASPGAAALQSFLDAMPANTHAVFVGRTSAPVALSRLQLTGQAVTITESELSLSSDQVDALLALHGRRLGDLGPYESHAGWPALVQLALEHGQPGEFVWEEVLRLLSDEQAAVLRALVAVEEATADVLEAVTGISDVSAVESIPLVHRRGDSYRAHDLWHELLADNPAAGGMRLAAANHLIAVGRHDEALDLCLRAGTDESLAEPLTIALRTAVIALDAPPDSTMREWRNGLSPQIAAEPIGMLLDGLIARVDAAVGDECDRLLRTAAERFAADDDADGAIAALSALTFTRSIRRDTPGLIEVFGQLQAYADRGEGRATPYPHLAQTLLANFTEDFPRARELTTELLDMPLSRETTGTALLLHANALTKLGYDAVAPAQRGLDLNLPMPGVRAIHLAAQWRMGVVDAFSEAGVFEQGDRDSYVAGVWFTCVTAALGDARPAAAALRTVEALPAAAGRDVQPESLWLAQASVALLEHRNADARAAMLRVVERFPLIGRAPAAFVWSLALAYELLPEHREFFDDQPQLGPLYHRDLRLNQAHKDLVATDDGAAIRRVEFPDDACELLPALGARFAAELLAGAWSHGHPSAEAMVHGFLDMVNEPGRAEFRSATEHSCRSIAKGAKEILESIPLAPSHVLELRLFGGTELRLDGTPVTDSDWRRERVRALLTFLVLHPETTRENVIAALWPDADTTAGRRSLRSTLNVLHAVLEPTRTAGDAPFFVRSVGQHLRLITGDVLRVDVARFDALLADVDALVAAGTPSLTIEPLRAAVTLYRGDLLPDSYDDWVVFARDRCRSRYVAAAVRCAELLVATGRPLEAIDLVTPVLAVEPWSEPAHRALIAAHVEHGDVAAARRSLATCHAALDDFGGPSEEPTLMLERRIMQR